MSAERHAQKQPVTEDSPVAEAAIGGATRHRPRVILGHHVARRCARTAASLWLAAAAMGAAAVDAAAVDAAAVDAAGT